MDFLKKTLEQIANFYLMYDVMIPWLAKYTDLESYLSSFVKNEKHLNCLASYYTRIIEYYKYNNPIYTTDENEITALKDLMKFSDRLDFNRQNFQYDLALLKLNSDIQICINKKLVKNCLLFPDENSRILHKFPEFKSQFDNRYNILPLKIFTLFGNILKYRNYVFHFNYYIGRHCEDVIKKIYRENKNLDIQIALDSQRVIHEDDYIESFKLSTWRGFEFNKEIQENNINIVTVIGRDKPTIAFKLGMKNLNRIEVLWEETIDKKRGKIRIFKLEEIILDSNKAETEFNNCSYIINRFFHSIYSLKLKKFVHTDASLNCYAKKEYWRRFESGLNKNFKSQIHKKLFQINGEINNEEWLDILLSFFQHDSAINELVLEYFDPENKMNHLLRYNLPEYMDY